MTGWFMVGSVSSQVTSVSHDFDLPEEIEEDFFFPESSLPEEPAPTDEWMDIPLMEQLPDETV